MNCLKAALALSLLTVPALSWSQDGAAATLGQVTGAVDVLLDGVEPWVAAKAGQQLTSGSQLRAGKSGTAVLVFFDGSKVRISRNTQFTIEGASPSNISMRLGLGKLEAWVAKLKGRKFQVRTGAMVAAVRGTVFAMESPDGKAARVDLFSGSLACMDSFGHSTTLNPGQSLAATQTGGAAAPAPLPPSAKAPPEPALAHGPPPPGGAQGKGPPPRGDRKGGPMGPGPGGVPPPPPPPNPLQNTSTTVSPSSP